METQSEEPIDRVDAALGEARTMLGADGFGLAVRVDRDIIEISVTAGGTPAMTASCLAQ